MEDRLQKFAKLVDAGSFTKAAGALHISQPALSTAINKLERELKTTLILRGTRPLKLTPSGEAAYAHAKETSVRTGNLRQRIAVGAQEKLAVRIGMIDSLADALFERGSGLTELEQHASISLVVDNSRYLSSAVARDDIDIAFVVDAHGHDSSISVELIGAEPLILVCHRGLLASVHETLSRGELPHFISYDQHSTTFRLIRRTLSERHVAVNPTFSSTSPEVIRKLVLARKGVAALPYLMVRDFIEKGQLKPIPIDGSPIIERPIQAIRHRDKVLPEPLAHMTTQLRTILQELMAEAL
jgi:DNA-binding transcriptional LysR family regulator